jgi:hypothetical protein
MWRGRCRVYFNTSDEAPNIWSIDNGTVEEEYKVVSIKFLVGNFRTVERIDADPAQPKVWLEHDRCAVYMNENNEVKITY